jgi:hypothetical protein
MRARLTSLLLATAWVAGVGCVSKPAEEPSTAVDAGAAVGGTARATADGAIGTSAIAAGLPASSNVAGTPGAAAPGPAAAHATSMRKASFSNGSGGNGATAPKVVPGNDNDIVARRLRKAAEQETNPTLRAKLWKEYTDYRQGTSAK